MSEFTTRAYAPSQRALGSDEQIFGAARANPGLGDRKQVRDHDRRTVGGFIALAAEGLARRAGAAMWLLPVRTNHERGRLAPAESQADTRPDRRAYEREPLPLRNLSTHCARGRARRAGGLAMT